MLAAVDRQGGPRHEPRILRAQKRYAARDLLGFAEPAYGDLCHNLFEHVARNRRHHVRVDIARRDRVDGDAGARAFLRQRLSEAVNAGLYQLLF